MGSGPTAALVAASVIVLVLALTAALAAIGLFRMAEYCRRHGAVRAPRCRVSDIYDLLKTGDLLLFVASTHSLTNSVFTQTFYSHVGVLLREGEIVRVSESQPGLGLMPDPARPGADRLMHRGADLTPLLTRLKYYPGDCYVLRLSRPLDSEREEALRRRAAALSREEYPYPGKAQLVLGFFGWATESRHCFQHVAHLLDSAGLGPLDRGPLSEAGFTGVCREICELPGRPLPGGYSYAPPLQLVYDVDAVGAAGLS